MPEKPTSLFHSCKHLWSKGPLPLDAASNFRHCSRPSFGKQKKYHLSDRFKFHGGSRNFNSPCPEGSLDISSQDTSSRRHFIRKLIPVTLLKHFSYQNILQTKCIRTKCPNTSYGWTVSSPSLGTENHFFSITSPALPPVIAHPYLEFKSVICKARGFHKQQLTNVIECHLAVSSQE